MLSIQDLIRAITKVLAIYTAAQSLNQIPRMFAKTTLPDLRYRLTTPRFRALCCSTSMFWVLVGLPIHFERTKMSIILLILVPMFIVLYLFI